MLTKTLLTLLGAAAPDPGPLPPSTRCPLSALSARSDDPPAPATEALFVERPEAFLKGVQRAGELVLVPDSVVTTCGSDSKEYILEVNGGAVALADFDADGWIDILVVDGSTIERAREVDARGAEREPQPGLPPRLFLNRGAEGPGTFVAAGPSWDLEGGRWGMGVATGDLDGDGFLDVVITQWGPDRVILNEGGRGFREITDEAGLRGSRWGTSAALFDFDGDGVLDLVVANYLAFDVEREIEMRATDPARWKGQQVMRGPEGMVPVHDQIYRGRGDGTFEALSSLDVGFEPAEGAGFSLGVMPLDFDRDGDVDVYVANDSTANYLFENQGDGTFAYVPTLRSGVAYDGNGKEQAGMGIASADANGDGRPDLLVTNFSGETNALYISQGQRYKERSALYGLRSPSLTKLGWGTGFGDYDLDGDLDAFVLNGHVYPQANAAGTDTSYAQDDQLYRRTAAQKFVAEPLSYVMPGLVEKGPTVSRAGAQADLDNDGDLDIVCLTMNGPVRVLENLTHSAGDTRRGAHWLRVQLAGSGANRFGIGAVVELEGPAGAQVAELHTAAGFQAAGPPELHFGLGDLERVDKLSVHWPGGETTVLEDVAVDRVLTIEEQ